MTQNAIKRFQFPSTSREQPDRIRPFYTFGLGSTVREGEMEGIAPPNAIRTDVFYMGGLNNAREENW